MIVMVKDYRRHLKNAPLESTFQDKVLKELRKIPKSWWQKINDRVAVGVADIFGAVNGYCVVIELKTRSKLTRLQLHNLEIADRTNCQSFCMTPENFKEIISFLHQLADIAPPAVSCLRKPARIPIWTLPPAPRLTSAKKSRE